MIGIRGMDSKEASRASPARADRVPLAYVNWSGPRSSDGSWPAGAREGEPRGLLRALSIDFRSVWPATRAGGSIPRSPGRR